MFDELDGEDADEGDIGLDKKDKRQRPKREALPADDSMNSSSISRYEKEETNLEPYVFENLPPHHCTYCGIHDPKTIVQCQSKNCNKWFCNGKGHPLPRHGNGPDHSQYGSHIVWHMVKSNHKEVQVHEESPLKDSPLECYVCASKNMFLLGYISAKTEACIILLCREPCLSKISQEDAHFDTANWMPLIENK